MLQPQQVTSGAMKHHRFYHTLQCGNDEMATGCFLFTLQCVQGQSISAG